MQIVYIHTRLLIYTNKIKAIDKSYYSGLLSEREYKKFSEKERIEFLKFLESPDIDLGPMARIESNEAKYQALKRKRFY